MMDLNEFDELEASVRDLISAAEMELESKRLEKQRNEHVNRTVAEIRRRLEPLLDEVQKTLDKLPPEDFGESPIRTQLEEKRADLQRQLDEAPLVAAEVADRQLLLQEERLFEAQQLEQENRWRQGLKEDLLETIAEQEDFYSATDAAVAIRGYADDLKAIDALPEVVEALIEQINRHSSEGPVAKLRGTHEQTLNFIYGKAMENRARVERGPEVQPRTRHRTSVKQPNPYTTLSGKVAIFGGHDRLESAVRKRLRDSDVDLVWCTAQAGLNRAEQVESHIASADLVLIVTGYASHSLTEKAIQSAKKSGIVPEMINTTGMTKLLEAIELGLKTRLLAKRLNAS